MILLVLALQSLPDAGAATVTREQAIAAAERRFTMLDRDGDGRLSADERPRRSDAHDTAAEMTREAFRDRALRRFDRADADGDGRVTAAERDTARAARRRSE